MARRTYPDAGSQLAFGVSGDYLAHRVGASVAFYTTSALTTLADVRVRNADGSTGSAYADSEVPVNSASMLPLFLGPDDDSDTLWYDRGGGVAEVVYARSDDRLDAAEDRLDDLESSSASLVYNVKADFGATGDGVADDTAEIQAAIDACEAAGGGTVFMPEGSYVITSRLTIDTNGVTLAGAGKRQTVLLASGGAGVTVTGASSIRYVVLRDFHLSGTGSPTDSGVILNRAVECHYENITVTGFTAVGKWGLEFQNGSANFYNSFAHCTFAGCQRGATVSGQDNSFVGCRFQGNTDLGCEDYCTGVVYAACGFEGNGSYGSTASQNGGKTYLGCYWERNVTANHYTVETKGLSILGGYCTPGSVPTAVGILLGRFAGTVAEGVTVRGVYFGAGFPTAGIHVLGVRDADLSANYDPQVVIEASAQLLGSYNIQNSREARATTREGFFGATPVVQPTSTTDLRTALINLGLLATGGATPLNLNGGTLTGASVNATTEVQVNTARALRNDGGSNLGVGEGWTTLNLRPSGNVAIADAKNLALGTTTGTKIGTATSQKIGFFNALPVTQPAGVADASGGAIIDAEARTAINTLIARLESLGLIATV